MKITPHLYAAGIWKLTSMRQADDDGGTGGNDSIAGVRLWEMLVGDKFLPKQNAAETSSNFLQNFHTIASG